MLIALWINFNVGEDRKKFEGAVIANAKTDGRIYMYTL